MAEKEFLSNYLQPVEQTLNTNFTIPLPDIEDLEKSADLIVQSTTDSTFSSSVISKYFSASYQTRLVEIYKNTQKLLTDEFVRLAGTMSIVRSGYPFLFIDAAITTVNPMTAQKEDLTTRVVVHFPQAGQERQKLLIDRLNALAETQKFQSKAMENPKMPSFWGKIWMGVTPGFDPGFIKTTRDQVWNVYRSMIEGDEADNSLDYDTVQKQMIFKQSAGEHQLFKNMGLDVPVEAQAAFFSTMVTGV